MMRNSARISAVWGLSVGGGVLLGCARDSGRGVMMVSVLLGLPDRTSDDGSESALLSFVDGCTSMKPFCMQYGMGKPGFNDSCRPLPVMWLALALEATSNTALRLGRQA